MHLFVCLFVRLVVLVRAFEWLRGGLLVCSFARLLVCLWRCLRICLFVCLLVRSFVCLHVLQALASACEVSASPPTGCASFGWALALPFALGFGFGASAVCPTCGSKAKGGSSFFGVEGGVFSLSER